MDILSKLHELKEAALLGEPKWRYVALTLHGVEGIEAYAIYDIETLDFCQAKTEQVNTLLKRVYTNISKSNLNTYLLMKELRDVYQSFPENLKG